MIAGASPAGTALRTPRLATPPLFLQPRLCRRIVREHAEQLNEGKPLTVRLAGCRLCHLASAVALALEGSVSQPGATLYIIPIRKEHPYLPWQTFSNHRDRSLDQNST